MRRFILFTLLFTACPCLSAYEYETPTIHVDSGILREDIPARLIELQSICTYQNPTEQDISLFYHRVTVPPRPIILTMQHYKRIKITSTIFSPLI